MSDRTEYRAARAAQLTERATLPTDREPDAAWLEPTSLLPLRWGRYRPRMLAGLAMITVGVASVLATTAYSLQFLAFGCLLQAVGWTVMPSAGWRRITVLVPAVACSCLLLGGGGFLGSFGVILAAWLLVRHRPLPAYILVVPPVVLGVGLSGVLFDDVVIDYQYAWIVLAIAGAVTVGCAWAARWVAVRLRAARPAASATRTARGIHAMPSRNRGQLR